MNLINLHIGSFNSRSRQVLPSGLAAASAYIAAAGFTNSSLISIINNFFVAMESTGLYSRFSHMKLNLTDSTNNAIALHQCSINAINPSQGKTIYSNNPIANYSGVSYNGINQFGRLNYNPSNDTNLSINDTSLIGYAYCSATAYLSWAQRNGGNGNIGLTVVNNGVTQNFINDAATIVTFSGLNTASGFNGASRKNINGTKYHFKNGVAITQTGSFVTSRANIDIVEGGRTLDGTSVANYYPMRVQFAAIGKGFSVAEMAIIEPIINNLQGSVDALFGLTGLNARKRY